MMAFSLITAMLFLMHPPIKQMTASFGPYSHYDSDLGHYDGHIRNSINTFCVTTCF